MSWNVVRGGGAARLAGALVINNSLLSLDLAWNALWDEGGMAFGNALAENSMLQELDLSSNRITERGAQVLGTALLANKTVTSLQLNNNQVGMEGGRALMGALHELGDLRNIGMVGCVFSSKDDRPVSRAPRTRTARKQGGAYKANAAQLPRRRWYPLAAGVL